MTLLAEYGMYHCYHVTEAAGQVTEKELEERLARLKGLDPSKCTSNKPVSTTSPVIM